MLIIFAIIAGLCGGTMFVVAEQCGTVSNPAYTIPVIMYEGETVPCELLIFNPDGWDPCDMVTNIEYLPPVPSFFSFGEIMSADPNIVVGRYDYCSDNYISNVNLATVLSQTITLSPGYLDAGNYVLMCKIKDKENETFASVKVTVKNSNAPPILLSAVQE